jgi:hypothetical protein
VIGLRESYLLVEEFKRFLEFKSYKFLGSAILRGINWVLENSSIIVDHGISGFMSLKFMFFTTSQFLRVLVLLT